MSTSVSSLGSARAVRAWIDGRKVRVELEDGREIRAIPLLEAAECPEALIFNRPVQVRMYKHPKLPRIVWIGRPDQ